MLSPNSTEQSGVCIRAPLTGELFAGGLPVDKYEYN
jgi:hypothetical protein